MQQQKRLDRRPFNLLETHSFHQDGSNYCNKARIGLSIIETEVELKLKAV